MIYFLGDIVKLKKGHPCGTDEWKILRTGVDIKLECMGCNRQVWLKRVDFNKSVKKIKDTNGKFVSIVNFKRDDLN